MTEAELDSLYAQIPKMECKEFSQTGGVACLACPMLQDGKCRVYDIRPMICRLWGAVEDLRCPHGCRPKELLSARDGKRLLKLACEV